MAQPKARLVTTFKCDRLWGRKTCDWFARRFPMYVGKTLVFDSRKATELSPQVFAWLTLNGLI